jgi:predicted RNA-binding protein associated with RNAse of E/G family
VKIYNFPNKLTSDGKEQLRKDFTEYFVKQKHCIVPFQKNCSQNIIIDEEQIKFNDFEFSGLPFMKLPTTKLLV